jgi:hypothetical protein
VERSMVNLPHRYRRLPPAKPGTHTAIASMRQG